VADLSINVQQDAFRVRDFVLGAAMGVALSAGVLEIAKIADTVQAALNPPPNLSVQVADEGCRPIDRVYGAMRYVQSQNALSAGLYESHVKLSETPTALRTLDPGLLQEVLRLDEFGQVDLRGLGAWVKVADQTPIAALVSGGDLSTGPLTEPLKLAETATPLLDSLQASGFDESLKIADAGFVELSVDAEILHLVETVTPAITPEQASGFDESLKIADVVLGPVLNPEQASPSELLHVVDATPLVSLSGSGVLSASGFDESLKVQDTATVVLTPLNAPTLTEALKVQDIVSPALWLGVQAGDETLHVQDSVSNPLLTPLQTAGFDELLHVQDSVLTGANIAGQATESLKIADSASPILDPERASGFDESLKIADSSAQTLDPLQTALTESLKLSETALPALSSGTTLTETLKLADTAQAALDLTVSVAEAVKVADSGTGQLTLLRASVAELVHVTDGPAIGQGDYIAVSLTETLHLYERAYTVAAPPDPDWVVLVRVDDWTVIVRSDEWTVRG
jgi:hypothetical protein